MKRRFQFASFVLVLLMLAPPVFASIQCGRNQEKQSCPKPCCEGMDGMSMPMDSDAAGSASHAQISQSPCCVVTEIEVTLPASSVDHSSANMAALLAPIAMILPPDLLLGHRMMAEFPPGDANREPALSRLCTFLI